MVDQQQYIDWLKHSIDYYGRYHDHKETMAWVATAFYIAGIVGLAYYLRRLEACPWIVVAGVFIAFAGFLIFFFVNWQFKRRWNAHAKVATYKEKLSNAVFCHERAYQEPWVKPISRPSCPRQVLTHIWKYKWPCREPDNRGLIPLQSEYITYIAIGVVTIAAIVAVAVPDAWIHS